MDSKKKIIDEISTVVQGLSQKIENLQAKVEELCRSTGDCKNIKKAHQELIPQKEKTNGINIDPLREAE